MFIWDTENNIGLSVFKSFRKIEVNLVNQEPPNKKGITIFFPDPFYMTIRTFDFSFGGKRAKKACEVEIASLEMFQGDKYLIWTPRRAGTSLVIIYEGEYVQSFVSEGISSMIFKPICLLHLCDGTNIVADIGEKTVSIASLIDKDFFRIAFFRYQTKEDIRAYVMLFLSGLKNRNLKFMVCGKRSEFFPFEAQVVKPSDIFDVQVDDPSFTSLFCAALGKYPDVRLKFVEYQPSLELLLQRSLGISVLSFIALALGFFPSFLELRHIEGKVKNLVNEKSQIFSSVFPDKKVVDPYSQLKIEYSRLVGNGDKSGFHVFARFAEAISLHVIRMEDFSLDSGEISAQLKIKEISDIQKIKEALEKFLKDVKVTSTVRSREGDSYIMRISGKL
ncbi:MAG: hypothetical protein NZ927_02390 [Candidatus Calescibacterium sp.]|nr:hypothetical protein [Candidatus Calescibacterium sp.]MCX7733463.1 hypothetical protein [bacterium]MDW8087444.1 hypothetical protein [Candidatus Calescibacterium sp.]